MIMIMIMIVIVIVIMIMQRMHPPCFPPWGYC